MKKIPEILFSKKNKAELEFEVFMLNTLFSRKDKLTYLLDRPHRVDFYLILFITKGIGVHSVDGQRCEYHEGSMLFISKGQVHAFDVHSDTDGFVILFTESFLSKNLIHSDILSLYRLYNYHLHSPIIQPEEVGTNLSFIIQEIYEEYNLSDNFAKEEILRLLLKLLLLKTERIRQTFIPKGKNSEWFIKFSIFRDNLSKHCTETRIVKEYADMMNMSCNHLNEICKSITGMTAKQFIVNNIILEIKRCLATSDLSIKELTHKLGFDEPTNFVKFFKKYTLQSPYQFKAILKK